MAESNAASDLGIAIIGSGLAGLTAGARLRDAGFRVTLYDKGRAPGGRISARTRPAGLFNHGAPVLGGEGAAFRAFLGSLPDGPNIRERLAPMVESLDIRTEVEVAGLAEVDEGWQINTAEGTTHGPFATVVMTVPAPQAMRLLEPLGLGLAEPIRAVRMRPVWSAMAMFDEPLPLDGDVSEGDVYRAVRQPDPSRHAWVIHMARDWTERHLERDKATFGPHILRAFADTFSLDLPAATHLAAHRWRYAFADRPLGAPYLGHAGRGLLIGGDWALGPHAEHAWQSGLAMADAVISG